MGKAHDGDRRGKPQTSQISATDSKGGMMSGVSNKNAVEMGAAKKVSAE